VSIPGAGVTPAASFELAGLEPQRPPPAILADLIDPVSGEYASLTRGASIADGMVTHLLSVQRGTGAAVRDIGHRLREITNVENQAGDLVKSFVRQALKPATDSGTIQIRTISATVNPDDGTQVDLFIDYVDALTPQPDPTTRRLTFSP
jgi:hypothetical protein